MQSVLQKRTFRYYNFFSCAKHSILPDKTSPARKRARRTYSQNSIAQKSKIIVSKGSFFIQSLNKLTPEFSHTHFILRKSYIKGKENKFGFIFCLWLHKLGTYLLKSLPQNNSATAKSQKIPFNPAKDRNRKPQ